MNKTYQKISAALRSGARSYSTIAVKNKLKPSEVVRNLTHHSELLRMYMDNGGKL